MKIGKTYKVTLEDRVVTGECLATLPDGALIGENFIEYLSMEGIELLGYVKKTIGGVRSRIGLPRAEEG